MKKIISKVHSIIQGINDECSIIRGTSDINTLAVISTSRPLERLHELLNILHDEEDEIKNLIIKNARLEMDIKKSDKERDCYIGALITIFNLIDPQRVSNLDLQELNSLVDNIRSLSTIPKSVKDNLLEKKNSL